MHRRLSLVALLVGLGWASLTSAQPAPPVGPAAPLTPTTWAAEADDAVWVAPAMPFAQPPTIDGELLEWELRPGPGLGLPAQTGFNERWTGREDFSARLWLAWDADYLYLAAQATDDKVVLAPGGDRNKGDLLRFWWAADAADAGVALTLQPAKDDLAAQLIDTGTGGALPGAVAAWVSVDRGWRAEARLPWVSLPGGPPGLDGERAWVAEVVDWDDDNNHHASLWFPTPTTPDPAPAAAPGWQPPTLGPPARPARWALARLTEPLDTDGMLAYLPACLALGTDLAFYRGGQSALLQAVSGLPPAAFARVDVWAAATDAEPALLTYVDEWTEGAVDGRSWRYVVPVDQDAPTLLVAAVRDPFLSARAYGWLQSIDSALADQLGRLSALRDRLHQLAIAPESDKRRRRYLGAVLIAIEEKQRSHDQWGSYRVAGDVDRLADSLEDLQKRADQAMAGEDPYIDRRGNVLRGYVSIMDDTLQHYAVGVPNAWKPGDKYPLVLTMHGYGFGQFLGSPAPVENGVIHVSAFGRGNGDYKLWCEEDLREVVQACLEDYGCDPDRVYATGGSMGGTGSWHIATMYPDVFAAIAPIMGNANHHVWEEVWGWGQREKTFMTPFRDWLESTTSAFTYAENLRHVPSWVVHGDRDDIVPVGHSRTMVQRLRGLGYRVDYEEQAGVGHGGFAAGTEARVKRAMLTQRRDPWPRRVTFKTSWPRYQRAYWIRLERASRPAVEAQIDARVLGQTIELTAVEVDRLSLTLAAPLIDVGQPVRVTVNEATAFDDLVPPDGVVRLGQVEGKWQPVNRPSGLEKNETVGGPLEHTYMGRFLLVYGTTGDERTNHVNRRMAEQAAEKWRRWGREQPARIKADHEVTQQDIADSNLLCYGSPESNSIVAQVNDQLPIRFVPATDTEPGGVTTGSETFRGVDVGLKMCYPNPLNPERYVGVFGGVTWRGTWDIDGRFGNFFDWGVFDDRNWYDFNIFDQQTQSPETHVLVGYFDADWQLDGGLLIRGDRAMRDAVQPRRPPDPMAGPPTADEIYLSELVPIRQRQEKGVLGYDQSFEGNRIKLGQTTFRRGLGIHPEAEMTYDIGGEYDLFDVWAGIDLEGATSVASAREDAEKVAFEVWGDGRLLADSGVMRWNTPPKHFVVRVTGVKELRLNARAMDGRKWLFGSAAWGEARVTRLSRRRAELGPALGQPVQRERLSLDGSWQVADYAVGAGLVEGADEGAGARTAINLPANLAAGLAAAGRLAALDTADGLKAAAALVDREWWLTREFEVPTAWRGRGLRLRLGGVVGVAEVWLNGQHIGRTSGAPEDTAELDLGPWATAGGTNTLALRLTAAPAEWSGVTWWQTPTRATVLAPPVAWGDDGGGVCLPLGVHGALEVQAVGPLQLSPLRVETALLDVAPAGEQAEVPARLRLRGDLTAAADAPDTAQVRVRLDSMVPDEPGLERVVDVNLQPGATVPYEVELDVPATKVWWPAGWGRPALYRLTVSLEGAGVASDVRTATVGFRDCGIGQNSLQLNGRPWTPRLARWKPVDRYLRASTDGTRRTLEAALAAGLNGLRVESGAAHASPDLLDLCDELGLVVVPEVPLDGGAPNLARELVIAEARGWTDLAAGHPSVLGFALGHEGSPQSQVVAAAAEFAQAMPEALLLSPTAREAGAQTWTWIRAAGDAALTLPAWQLNPVPTLPSRWSAGGRPALDGTGELWPQTAQWTDLGGSTAEPARLTAMMGDAADMAALARRLRWLQAETLRQDLAAWQGETLCVDSLTESWARVGGALVDHSGAVRPGWGVLAERLTPGAVWPELDRDALARGDKLELRAGTASEPPDRRVRLRVMDLGGGVWAEQEFERRTAPEQRRLIWQPDISGPGGAFVVLAELAGQPARTVGAPVVLDARPSGGALPVVLSGAPVALPRGLEQVSVGPAWWIRADGDQPLAWRVALDSGAGLFIDGWPARGTESIAPGRTEFPAQGSTYASPRVPQVRTPDHPVLAGVPEWPGVSDAEPLHLVSGALVLVEAEGGRPLLVETNEGDQRILWLLARPSYRAKLTAWAGWRRLMLNAVAYVGGAPYGRLEQALGVSGSAAWRPFESAPAQTIALAAEGEAETTRPGVVRRKVTVTNRGTGYAPFVWLTLNGVPGGALATLRPNGFSLAPGDAETVWLEAQTETAPLAAEVTVSSGGWGVQPVDLAVRLDGG